MATSPATSTLSKFATSSRQFFESIEPLCYALLRVTLAIVLITHGLPKLLGTSHGTMANPMAVTIHLIQDVVGLPFAPQLAFLVMILETLGGLMLAIGLLTRPIALFVALEMVGISLALGPTWAWINRGIEYPVLMGVLALYILAKGAGAYSWDNRRQFALGLRAVAGRG